MEPNAKRSQSPAENLPDVDRENKILVRARNAAYRLLTYRPRSKVELEEKLRDKEFPDDIVAIVLNDCVRFGYVNDREFARAWAGARVRLRGFGRRRIEQELRTRGIERDIIRQTLADLFASDAEQEVARHEAEKKLKSLRRFEPDVRRRRLAGHLERKGFSSEIIRAVLAGIRHTDAQET